MVNNDKGLTLVELLASIVVMGIVVTLFITLSGDTSNADKHDQLSVQAVQIDEQIINQVRSAISDKQVQNNNTPLTSDTIKSIVSGSSYNFANLNNLYQVVTQYSDFATGPSYDTSKFKSHLVSLQSIVLVKDSTIDTNGIITVTVSWGDS